MSPLVTTGPLLDSVPGANRNRAQADAGMFAPICADNFFGDGRAESKPAQTLPVFDTFLADTRLLYDNDPSSQG